VTVVEHVDRGSSLEELEELWRAEPRAEPAPAHDYARIVARALPWGWTLFLVLVSVLAPAPQHGVREPAWAGACNALFVLVLAASAIVARAGGRRLALGGSAFAAGLGALLAFECRASGHHLGLFWIAELVPCLALLGASLYAFDRSPRRR
jgi:hypothetical protein